MRRLGAFIFCWLSLVLPLVVVASASDYTDWRKSDGTPQSVMLSYYDGPDTRGFAWQTSTEVTSGKLWVVAGEHGSDDSAFDSASSVTATSAKHDDCYTHMAYVTGLSAGTYSYRLGTASHYAYGKFEVRDRAKPFVAANFSDVQMEKSEDLYMWKNAVTAACAVLGGGSTADTVIYCGDFFDMNSSRTPEAKTKYVRWGVTADQARPEFADVAWTMVSGNHDPDYFDTCICEHFNYTDNDNYGCHSFDYGNVHIATLPHTTADKDEKNAVLKSKVKSWLQDDLAAAQGATWRILVVHMGPYTTGDNGYNIKSSYIEDLAGICATYKVDLVLQGHDHIYSKTLPYLWSGPGYTSSDSDDTAVNLKPATVVIGGETYYDNPEGTVYVSPGCAGDRVGENTEYASTKYKERSCKTVTDKVNVKSTYANVGDDGSKSVNAPMFAVLTIDGETLKYDWYVAASATPVLFDTLRIAKSGSEPVDPEPEAEELGLAVNGSFARLLSSDEPVTWSVACEPADIVSATLDRATGEETVLRLAGLAEGTATVTVSRLGANGEPVAFLQYAVTVAGEEVEPDDPTPPPPVEPTGEPEEVKSVELAVNEFVRFTFEDPDGDDYYWLVGATDASVASGTLDRETASEARYAGFSVRTTSAAPQTTLTISGLKAGSSRIYLARQYGTSETYFYVAARFDVTVGGGGEPVVPEPVDEDETVTLAPGGTTNLTTVTSAGAWNVLSDSSCVTASAVTNADGTCTVALSCTAVCERDVAVEIRRGSETPGAGRLVKTVTVRTAAADESFVLALGEQAAVSASHPNGRFWSVSESSTCAAALSSSDRVKDIVLTLTATNGGEEVITLYQKTEPTADPVASRIIHVRVKPAATVVTPPTASGSFTYGQALSDLELTDGAAEVEGTFSWTAPSAYPPAGGSVPVEVTFTPTGEAAELYSPVTFTITLSVAKRVLTVTPVDVAIVTGEAIPDDAYELSGLAAGDRADTIGLSGSPTYESAYDPENPVEGEYAFAVQDVSQMSSANYTFVASADTAMLTVKPDNILEDQPDTIELRAGESVTFVTRQTNDKWYSKSSDTGTATVSGVRDGETGSYALTITGVYADSSAATVTVRYGTTSSTGGTKLKEIKVTVLPAEETIHLHVGEKTTRTVEFSSSRYWLAGGSGANGTFEYASASFAASAKETSSYSGYSIRTTSTAKKADMIFEALSVGTETITVARQNNTSSPTPMYVYTVVVERGLEPSVAPAVTIPYGTRLGDAEVIGTMVDPDGNPVEGTFVFDDPEAYPGVQQSGAFAAQFVPSDDAWQPVAVTVDVTVTKATCDMSGVRMENVTVTYDGAKHSIVVEGLPKDVSVKGWTNNGRTDAGTYQVTATFTTSDADNYEIPEPMTATLVIEPAPITSAVAEPQAWDGTKKTPNVVVKAGTLSATATVGEWSGNLTDIGRYTTTVTGTGNFTGELPVAFDIVRPRETPQPEGPFTATITNGWRLADAVVEGRMLQGDAAVRGWFDFGNRAETKPSASGSFAALFRPLDTDRYSEVEVQVAVTVEADASRIVVNGVRYIDVDQPLGRIWANGGTAEFLKDVDYDSCTFAAGATAKVARGGVWVFAGAVTMRAVTAGRGIVAEALTLAGDVPADGTFVSAKALTLGADVTVGGALALESLVPDGHRIVLSGAGVVRTIGSEPLAVEETFAVPSEGRTIVETKVLSGYEYALSESQGDVAFRTWCEAKGIDYQTALASPGGFFSFATDQDRIVDPGGIDDSKVKIEEVKVNDGEVTLTVGIDGLPVGENAQAEYLEKVFGVTGTAALDEAFAAEKVTYRGDMTNNKDGTVSYSAEPKVEEGDPKPDAFFFKATIAK